MKKFFLMVLAVVTLAGLMVISGCKKKETYTVTFNANGGIGTMTEQTFTEGEAQALTRNAFTYDGHTFSGWNTVQSGSGASYTDGQTITATADLTLYAQWENITRGQSNGHDWVDLGLPSGTKWATCNVGAETIEGYGNYYAWGETEPKEIYDWNNYRWCNGLENSLIKYCNSSDFSNNGFVDTLTVLELDDDVATVNWGTNWRMPTQYEMIELFSECSHEWITLNGINGRKFTGPNGNSIFLPAAGLRKDNDMSYVGSEVYYWTSTLPPYYTNQNSAWALYFKNNTCDLTGPYRYYGIVVRPVLIENN